MSTSKKNNEVPSPIDLEKEENEQLVMATLDDTPETKKMTPLQKNLTVQMVAHPDKTEEQQCKDAGYKVTDGSRTSGIMVAMKGKLANSLEAAGIHLPRVLQIINAGLEAETPHFIKIAIRDKGGKVTGEEIKTISTPDHRVIIQYAKLALALGQRMPANKVEVEGPIKHEHEIFLPQELYNSVPVNALRKRAALVKKEIEADYEVVNEDVA